MDVTAKSPIVAFTNAIVNSLQDSGHVFDSQEPFLQQVRLVLPYFHKLQRRIEIMVETEIDKGVVQVHAHVTEPTVRFITDNS